MGLFDIFRRHKKETAGQCGKCQHGAVKFGLPVGQQQFKYQRKPSGGST